MDDWAILVREQAACCIWSLAGEEKPTRKRVSEEIGVPQIISMIMSKSEKLQYVGCKCMISLVYEDVKYQNIMMREHGIDSLIRLLKNDKTSDRVLKTVIETIGAMCVDIAHVNNPMTQQSLKDKNVIGLLMSILKKPRNKLIEIEAAHSLACLKLNQPKDFTQQNDDVDIEIIIDLLQTDDLNGRLKAGLALTVLAFNNNEIQYLIKMHGGISFVNYQKYFEDENIDSYYLCQAAFQVILF
jgi:hypothetical protein